MKQVFQVFHNLIAYLSVSVPYLPPNIEKETAQIPPTEKYLIMMCNLMPAVIIKFALKPIFTAGINLDTTFTFGFKDIQAYLEVFL